MLPQTIEVRATLVTVGSVKTQVARLEHTGPPARTFFFAANVPTGSDENQELTVERRVISQAVEQFLLWVQNGKPSA